MIKIAISGILGRMGKLVYNEISQDDKFTFVGGFDQIDTDVSVSTLTALPNCDVLIDFSHKNNLVNILRFAEERNIRLVLATTGYDETDFKLIESYSQKIPIFYSSNYSVGMYVMNQVVQLIAQAIDASFDIEITEKHHRFKKDNPSGSAYTLKETIENALQTQKKIPIHGLRLGNYVGEHSVYFSSLTETIQITHQAHDRSLFAQGALKAAVFMSQQKAGLYGMDDLVGGNDA